jgi:hypothetical protein
MSQADVVALDTLELGKLLVDPATRTHKSSFSECERPDDLYESLMSPSEIRGYCSTRADDLYRLSETSFNACGAYLSRSGTDITEAKRLWRLDHFTALKSKFDSRDVEIYKVLNAFHDAMFELSDSRWIDKPEYKGWNNRFEEALQNYPREVLAALSI